ncbi:ATP-binding protein [Clostridium sp. HBUAS56010]|uniref:ATP-binding protein n=1 Tax=Clostridium sp. HBUAS56010 TaxID=2571127 RepID=UPI001A9BD23D|nr:ATP-binding protein [Clostridium sp. HBUAS56010]
MIISKESSVLDRVMTGIAVSVGSAALTGAFQIFKSMKLSTINVAEWDNSYNKVNKLVYSLCPDKYEKHKAPTTNNDFFELEEDSTYMIKLDKMNYLKVNASRENKDKIGYSPHRIKLSFLGKNRYENRVKFLKDTLKITDKSHINVTYLNDFDVSCDIIPHDFDNIVLNKEVKGRIVDGLTNWKNSEEWYKNHQLTHKIGVFLYGKPGTGKSTIAKAISCMFDNAPILTVNPDSIMKSVNSIIKMRKKYCGTIVVLIEDFDMYFKSREELEGIELAVDQKKQKDNNQNALFQLLDGVYSTSNTIYVATTNYKDRIDSALIRHGRFDIQEELNYFEKSEALECVKLLGYDEKVLNNLGLEYPVQPSYLQSKVMEFRSKLRCAN